MRALLPILLTLIVLPCLAQGQLDSLLLVYQNAKEDSSKIEALIDLGNFYVRKDKKLAFQYVEELEYLARNTNDKRGLFNAYNIYGNLHQLASDYSKSDEYYKRCISLLEDSINIARVYGNVGTNHFLQSEYDSALHYYKLGYEIKIRNDSTDYVSLGNSLYNMAYFAESNNEYIKATEYYIKASNYFKKADAKKSLAASYNAIGIMYKNSGDTTTGIKYLEQCLALSIKNEDHLTIGNSSINLGNIFYGLEDFPQAKKYLKNACKSLEQIGSKRYITNAYNSLGDVYLYEDSLELAQEYFQKSYDISTEISATESLIESVLGLSDIQLKKSNFNKAQQFINQGKELANIENNLKDRSKIYRRSYEINEILGNQSEAFKDYKIYMTARDSLFRLRNDEVVEEMQEKYQAIEKDNKISVQALQIEKESKQKNFFLVGFIVLGLLGTLIINRYLWKERMAKEKYQNLENKQKILALDYMVMGQEEERKRIAKDLHDGLGGMLTMVRLQIQNIQNEIGKLADLNLLSTAEEMVDDACDEVRRIAHNMMPDALIDLGLKAAIIDLAKSVSKTSNIHVDTYFSHEEFHLSEKSNVIIYRIIQEIANNAIKYSKAKKMMIQIMQEDKHLHLTVEDDGIGFDLKKVEEQEGMGIKNIRSRTKYLDAELVIESSIGEGCSYSIKIKKDEINKSGAGFRGSLP